MRDLSIPARVYIWATLVLGALVLLWSGVALPADKSGQFAFAALAVAAAIAQTFPVLTPKNQAYELTPIFVFAGVLLLPADALSLLIVLTFIPEWVKARKRWYIQLFNIAIYRLQAVLARAVYEWVAADPNGLLGDAAGPIGAMLGACLFSAANHLLLAVVLHLARGHSWRETRLFELQYFLTDATLCCTGAIAGLLWQANPWLSLLVAAPLFLIYRALNTPNLQEEARTDPKTGLYNSKHFNRVLHEEFRRASRFERPLAVIMADLDFLREINNRYGHIAGDAVIRDVAQIMKRGLREYDVAARFGGEEFVVLLPETDTAQGLVVAERLRMQVEESRIAVTTSVEPIRVTISLGVASFPADAPTPEGIVHQADLAVYYAKLQGRNQSQPCGTDTRALGGPREGERGIPLAVGGPSSSRSGGVEPRPATPELSGPGETVDGDGQRYGDHGASPTEAAGLDEPVAPRPGANGGREAPRRKKAADPSWAVAILITATVSIALAVWLANRPWQALVDWPGMVALGILTAGAQSLGVEIYGRGRISTSAVIVMAGGIIFGMPGALLLAPVIPVTVWLQNRGFIHRALFDLGDTVLSGALGAAAYHGFAGTMPSREPVMLLAPAVLGALAYYAINVGLISVAIGLTEGRSPVAVWTEKFRWLPLHYTVFGVLALLVALAYEAIGIYGLVSLAVPPLMLRYVMKQYIDHTEANVTELKRVHEELLTAHEEVVTTLRELRATYDATLMALSAALDSRDAETEGHCKMVVEYAAAIAARLDLPAQQMSNLLNGALLHDVGKIGVPDAVLGKPGPLTDSEWDAMRKHPEIGYRMLQHIGFLRDAIPIVRYHHERYDGKGYPFGLRGDQIPLGARIFAVADAFHAMTSNRPYRSAQSIEEARREIARCAGTQFDPRVVEAFLSIDPGVLAEPGEQALGENAPVNSSTISRSAGVVLRQVPSSM